MSYWEIDGKIFEDEFEAKDYIRDNIDESMYDDMLDEIYGDIEICGYSYSASLAFERVDPIAYNVGFNDYTSNMDIDLPESYDGEDENIYGCEVIYHEEDEDEDEDDDDDIYDESYRHNKRSVGVNRSRRLSYNERLNRRRRRF